MRFTARSGRLTLTLRLCRMGRDWQAVLTGGEAHLGGTALAVPEAAPSSPAGAAGVTVRVLSRDTRHKDHELAAFLARALAAQLACAVCVSAGVHYDRISKEEIHEARLLTERLAGRCLAALARAGRA
ncbi:hypothetical protein [Desulfovibrio sp. ZJ200]|uniref:prenylated flavin chaperone LpdD n=1 Tax=Desulfovibrio sp. ZJ200 TaxID=2709792 RepID=UPI0013EBD1BF|nr:hypothetical protein [Desulfovibrio sp. ZJ200]